MDYEHFVVAAARVVEFVGVAVLLIGALLAAAAFARCLLNRATSCEVRNLFRKAERKGLRHRGDRALKSAGLE